jgi:ribosomal protein S12 methylthiotransferase accessory factor
VYGPFCTSLSDWHCKVVDPITGLVPFLFETEMARSDPDLFVFAAQSADVGNHTEVNLTGSSAGLTLASAADAAIGEAVERYCASIVHPEDLVFGTYEDLTKRGYACVAPEAWALFEPWQLESSPFVEFTRKTPVAWIMAQSLTHHSDRLVPACLAFLSSREPFVRNNSKLIAAAISTGTACAPSRVEALMKAIFEAVERDAFMISWRTCQRRPRVEIDEASELHSIFREKFARPGLDYQLYYTTWDLRLPSFFGILRDERREPKATVVGGSCHPNPEVAALKTLIELVQGLKWLDYMGPQTYPVEANFSNIRSFTDRVSLYANNDLSDAFRFLFEGRERLRLSDIPAYTCGSVQKLVSDLAIASKSQKLEVLALDQTTADIASCGLSVVRLLIPGLEQMEGDHRFQFLGGRRWREVPAACGAAASILDRQSLNSFPHPYP